MRRDELEAGLELEPRKTRLKTKIMIGFLALAILGGAAPASSLYGVARGAEKEPRAVTSALPGEQLRSVQELAE